MRTEYWTSLHDALSYLAEASALAEASLSTDIKTERRSMQRSLSITTVWRILANVHRNNDALQILACIAEFSAQMTDIEMKRE